MDHQKEREGGKTPGNLSISWRTGPQSHRDKRELLKRKGKKKMFCDVCTGATTVSVKKYMVLCRSNLVRARRRGSLSYPSADLELKKNERKGEEVGSGRTKRSERSSSNLKKMKSRREEKRKLFGVVSKTGHHKENKADKKGCRDQTSRDGLQEG